MTTTVHDALLDPVTVEVVRHGLVAAAEQMATSIERSARSQVIREMLDYSTAVFGLDGGIIAQSTRIPIHLNSMTRPLQAMLTGEFPLEVWREGDVFITNDPYAGGQHLPDIMTFAPVFCDAMPIAIAGTLGHHLDVGGRGPGSYGADATEIFQEGFQIPPLRVATGGDLSDVFLRLFSRNIRVPSKTVGDLHAQLAALKIGAAEIRRLGRRYGTETLLAAMHELVESSRRSMEAAIRRLPEGVFRAEDVVDGDGLDDEPIPVRVAVHRDGSRLVVDFEGTGEQVRGPINCPIAATESAVYYAVTAVLEPGVAPNRGAYEPIEVRAPLGSALNPRRPAPVVGRNVFTHRVATVTMAALAEALPERACASHYGNSNVHILATQGPEEDHNVLFEIEVGGWGGRPGSDGPDSLSAGIHNLANNPVELVEHDFPDVRVAHYRLRCDSGGPGEFRGGLGVDRTLEVLGPCDFSAQFDRVKFPPPGLRGGLPGGTARLVVSRDGETVDLPGKVLAYGLRPGDRLSVLTQGGGGLGDPQRRDRRRVVEDVREGKVSRELARTAYGLETSDLEGVAL